MRTFFLYSVFLFLSFEGGGALAGADDYLEPIAKAARSLHTRALEQSQHDAQSTLDEELEIASAEFREQLRHFTSDDTQYTPKIIALVAALQKANKRTIAVCFASDGVYDPSPRGKFRTRSEFLAYRLKALQIPALVYGADSANTFSGEVTGNYFVLRVDNSNPDQASQWVSPDDRPIRCDLYLMIRGLCECLEPGDCCSGLYSTKPESLPLEETVDAIEETVLAPGGLMFLHGSPFHFPKNAAFKTGSIYDTEIDSQVYPSLHFRRKSKEKENVGIF